MTSLKCSKNSGVILIDILLALSLAALFISIIAESSFGARNLYHRARDRDEIMDALLLKEPSFEGMMPYEARADMMSSTSAEAVWYGNDRIETDMKAIATGTPALDLNAQTVDFSEIRAYPYADMRDAAGTPLCSADFLHGHKLSDATITAIQLPVNPSVHSAHGPSGKRWDRVYLS